MGGEIKNFYVGLSIINVNNLNPTILVVRVVFINPSMGGDFLLNVASYAPNASTGGSLVPSRPYCKAIYVRDLKFFVLPSFNKQYNIKIISDPT